MQTFLNLLPDTFIIMLTTAVPGIFAMLTAEIRLWAICFMLIGWSTAYIVAAGIRTGPFRAG